MNRAEAAPILANAINVQAKRLGVVPTDTHFVERVIRDGLTREGSLLASAAQQFTPLDQHGLATLRRATNGSQR